MCTHRCIHTSACSPISIIPTSYQHSEKGIHVHTAPCKMYTMRRFVPSMLTLVFVLTGCTPHRECCDPPPRGPVQTRAEADVADGTFDDALAASTNCADIGQIITFEVRFYNRRLEPVTLTDDPPFDIEIRPARPDASVPVQVWSQHADYPQPIKPVIAAGETRVYQWHWRAEPVYGRALLDGYGVTVTLRARIRFSPNSPSIDATTQAYIGVKSYGLGSGAALCADMPQ